MKSNVYLFPDRKKKGNAAQTNATQIGATQINSTKTQSVPSIAPESPIKHLAGTKLSSEALRELAQSKKYNSGAVLKSPHASPDNTKSYRFNELQALTQNLNRLQNLHSRLRFMITELEGLVIKG